MYYLIYKSKSMTSLSHLLSKKEGFVSEVISKDKGKCYGMFFFFLAFSPNYFFFCFFSEKASKKNYQRAKLVELHNTKVKIITSVELQNIFAFCKQCAAGTGKPIIFKSINIVERRSPTVIFSSIAKGAIEIKTSHRAIINCIKNNTIFRNIYNV